MKLFDLWIFLMIVVGVIVGNLITVVIVAWMRNAGIL
jgi:hypothetical protein